MMIDYLIGNLFERTLFLVLCLFLFQAPVTNLSAQGHEGHKHHSMTEPSSDSSEREVDFWTCSMHPQIKLPESGQCPICRMDLIPVYQDDSSDVDGGGVVSLKLSETAEKLADIQTTAAVNKQVVKHLALVGVVDYDETRLTHITAWVPGRIDRMFVDFTGIKVRKSDHMVEVYSPELISSQEELIQAVRSLKRLGTSASSLVKKSTEQAIRSAREKLTLLGLTKEQVKNIEQSGKAQDRVVIYAPVGGVVVERNATEGMYVNVGTKIYSIADLSHLWIHLDAYESDLPWLRYGQKVVFTTQALPGVEFEGKVSFISPVVNPATRTTRVRVNIDNSKGILKPGLFVNGVVEARVSTDGVVMDASLKGKHVCPMHPEVIEDVPGECPVCGMDLVPASELGEFVDTDSIEPPLVIPQSAALITGKRAVVYVKDPEKSVYELRKVVLGPKVENYYIVYDGIRSGELVVTNGAFKIDADLQIRGKESMMNPAGGKQSGGHMHSHGSGEKGSDGNG